MPRVALAMVIFLSTIALAGCAGGVTEQEAPPIAAPAKPAPLSNGKKGDKVVAPQMDPKL